MNGPGTFLVANLALAFYLVGAIWAHEVDIFRNWQVLDLSNFRRLQTVHFKKLPYWIFAPVGFALAGSAALVWYHPTGSPAWAIWGNLGCQVLSLVLTAIWWGRWQGCLARDPRGAQSPYLARILATHWLRTLLINACALCLLVWVIELARFA